MEKTLKFKTKDGHTIYGTLNAPAKGAGSVVVFVHGLTGHQNEHYYYNAARFFPKKGFATYRFDLYSGEKGGRSLSDCTVQVHASDLSLVLNKLKGTYRSIHVVGHSLGGPSIVLADISAVASVVLWDPSDMLGLADITEGQERTLKRNKISGRYIVDWGTEYILGNKMAQEFKTLRPATLAGTINKPLKIIAAEKGNTRGSKEYLKYANEPKELVIIKKAGHTFTEEDTEEQLFEETLSWVKKWDA
jgi:alpha-beta hydrolase superfamily lysophospholipase